MKQIKYLCLILLFIFAGSALSLEKTNPKYWKIKIKENPKSALNYYNLGVAYHKLKKYKSAAKAYMKVIKLKSTLTPVCQYNIAQIYQKVGKIDVAKKYINKVDISSVPKNLRKRVLLFKNSLYLAPETEEQQIEATETDQQSEEPQEEKKWSAYLEISNGTNDNPTYSSSSTDSDSQTSYKVFMGYQLMAGDNYEWSSSYSYNLIDYKTNSDSESSYHDISLPYAYYLADHRFRFIPGYTTDTYGGSAYSNTSAFAGDWAFKLSDYFLTLYYQSSTMDVVDTDSSYLSGNAGKFKLSVKSQSESSSTTLGLQYSDYNYNDTDSVTSSYTAPALDISYGYYWETVDLSLYASYESRTYSADSSGTVRTDSRVSTSFQAGWAAHKYLRIFADISYNTNASSDSDNDYTQSAALLGLSSGF